MSGKLCVLLCYHGHGAGRQREVKKRSHYEACDDSTVYEIGLAEQSDVDVIVVPTRLVALML